MHLRSEGRSDNTQYAALYRLFKYLSWLEEKGMRMDSATALDVKAFLAGFDVVATRRRMAAVLKGFYRFLIEHFDEVRDVLASRGMKVKADAAFFEKVYRASRLGCQRLRLRWRPNTTTGVNATVFFVWCDDSLPVLGRRYLSAAPRVRRLQEGVHR